MNSQVLCPLKWITAVLVYDKKYGKYFVRLLAFKQSHVLIYRYMKD